MYRCVERGYEAVERRGCALNCTVRYVGITYVHKLVNKKYTTVPKYKLYRTGTGDYRTGTVPLCHTVYHLLLHNIACIFTKTRTHQHKGPDSTYVTGTVRSRAPDGAYRKLALLASHLDAKIPDKRFRRATQRNGQHMASNFLKLKVGDIIIL